MAAEQVLHMEIAWKITGKNAEDQIQAIKDMAEKLLNSADASNTYRTFGELWSPIHVPKRPLVLIPSLRYYDAHKK